MTPLGNDVESTWKNALAGVSGVGPITRVDSSEYTAKVAAELKDFNIEDYMEKSAKNGTLHAICSRCCSKALEDSRLEITDEIAPRVGVWVGSGIGGLETFEEQFEVYSNKGARRVSPFFVPMMIPDMATGQISIALGAKGLTLVQ